MLGVQLLLLPLCVLGAAFFSGVETGVISIRRLRLRHLVKEGDVPATILSRFLEKPDRLLGTTLVGTNICIVTASIIAASAAARAFAAWGEVGSSVVMTLVLVVFGEYIPKAWFRARPLERCRPAARLLEGAGFVLQPATTALRWLGRLVIPSRIAARTSMRFFATRDELKLLAREGEQFGVLSPDERSMIHSVFELSAKTARQVMIPRDRMVSVPATASVREFFQKARDSGFTRLPVCDAPTGRFTGVVNLFDVLAVAPLDSPDPLTPFVRPPLFVPEQTPADEILPRLRLARQPLGLVTDARAAVIGLVTTEDILEEIVGEL